MNTKIYFSSFKVNIGKTSIIMYNLVDKFKSNAQTSFEKSTAKSSIKTGKQGKFKLITL